MNEFENPAAAAFVQIAAFASTEPTPQLTAVVSDFEVSHAGVVARHPNVDRYPDDDDLDIPATD
jgi:hypothetical protein